MFWERKEFVIKVQKDSSLNTQVINVSTKEVKGQPSERNGVNEAAALF